MMLLALMMALGLRLLPAQAGLILLALLFLQAPQTHRRAAVQRAIP